MTRADAPFHVPEASHPALRCVVMSVVAACQASLAEACSISLIGTEANSPAYTPGAKAYLAKQWKGSEGLIRAMVICDAEDNPVD